MVLSFYTGEWVAGIICLVLTLYSIIVSQFTEKHILSQLQQMESISPNSADIFRRVTDVRLQWILILGALVISIIFTGVIFLVLN